MLLPACTGGDSRKTDDAEAGAAAEPAGAKAGAESSEKEAGTEAAPAGGEVTERAQWTDEAGNFIGFRDDPELVNPDIVAVHALSADGRLVVVYRFAEGNLQKCFDQKPGSPPMHSGAGISELYLDLDNDPATGGQTGRADNEQGYELKLSVMTGFGFVNSDNGRSDAMFGDVGFPENLTDLKPDASQMTWILDPKAGEKGSWSQLGSDRQRQESRRMTVLSKDQVTVYLPYEWFGMKPGDVIRLAYTDEKGSNDGMSEVRRVRLK